MLDAYWALMLAEGRGGFIDYGEYRDRLTEIVWEGTTPAAPVAEAPSPKGSPAKPKPAPKPPKPAPRSAMEEARAMYERSKLLQAAQEK